MSEVFLKNITKIFPRPRTVAVDDITILFEKSKTSCILGPSGCGKTTLLRIIAGLLKPTKGDVYIDGEKVTNLPPYKRNIGMIFQFAVVYDAMTVFENLAAPLKSLGYSKNEINTQVKEIAEILGLTHLLRKSPVGLDIGIRQRIAFARALIRRPKILLLDEPLTNLDPLSRLHLRYEIKRLQRKWNQTIIYVTHDQSEALTLGDKIAVMNLGKILQYDTPDSIYRKPLDTFCASFIGNPGMNIIEANIEEKHNEIYLIIDSERINVSKFKDILQNRSKIILGIRPEHIGILKEKGKESLLKKKIYTVEVMGNIMILSFELNGKVVKAKIPATLEIKEGDNVWIHFNENEIKFFDPTTSKLIA
jgi:multiple sugar transport system ATP-binding protein